MRPIDDLFAESDRHLQALQEAIGRCPRPLTADHFAQRDAALVAALDQFAYRFTKLQDMMSAQLFRSFAVQVLAEPVESAPIIDLLNVLDRLGFLPSAARWQEIRQMRNQIAHEYQLTPTELAVTLEVAFAMVQEMADIVSRLRARASQRKSAGA